MTDREADGALPARTVGGFDQTGRTWVLVLFALGGAGIGAVIPLLSGWAAQLAWVPFEGPLRLLGSFDQQWLVWGRPALGLLLGLAFATWVIHDSPVLAIDGKHVTVRRRGEVQRVIARDTVAAVYPKGAKIIVETEAGRVLFGEDVEGDKAAVREAFIEHGYPWEGPRE
ncbi:YqeB family protein [Ornithinimicrobium sufpigmenti]|uniref:YqeB family protein n=1 Tax=Ornithinimicrobium sufpigmenti TaxID=2508882 RepID=UPI001053E8E8|nr:MULTISPECIES: hypothetical protein [unclassified Ornithinimicrobium]